MRDEPRDDARLSADALRMRESIERRLFAPRMVVLQPGRRRWQLGGVHERRPRWIGAIVLAMAMLVGGLIGFVLRG
jgi:hypothetical protein